ncbi:fumarylacetoacetate hydrolase family protein [Jeotgalicoccus huakuii]|nr:fumarylacetoacetate hydrolase family protein [Jeotgalicoccus huakuii]
MKFLTFEYKEKNYYGVKVKREDSAWILPLLFEDFSDVKDYPRTLLEGITEYHTLDFQELVRKLVESAEVSENADQYKAPFDEINILAPVKPPNNTISFGRNFKEHAEELNNEVELYVFTKANSSLVGDEATISSFSDITSELDYEGELGVVIGKSGRNIDRSMAYDYVYGYTIVNDISARDLQKSHKQAFLSKSLATPMGPYIVTKDEIPNAMDAQIVTKVNDEIRQDGSTALMVRKIDDLISELSKYVTLEPGDVIATGTPAGVGAGMDPKGFVKSGDTVRVSIDGIGTLTTHIE